MMCFLYGIVSLNECAATPKAAGAAAVYALTLAAG